MNTHHRGVYQPLMENIPVYDLSDDEVEEDERSRLPLLIVIALLALAAFAGVVWLAYNQGVARGRSGAEIVVAAPEGPVRTAPSESGGAATPFTGLKVYDQPVPPDQEAQASVLAQPPDAVLPSPPSFLVADVPQIRAGSDTSVPAAASRQTGLSPAPQPVQAPAATGSVLSGQAVLQIGAYESEEIANGAWTNFLARHGAVAGTLTRDIKRVDLGAKGIWFRLRAGPFAGRAEAAAACESLKTRGAACFVTAP
jgi:SPOR domain